MQEIIQQMVSGKTDGRPLPSPGTFQTYKSIIIKADYEKAILDSEIFGLDLNRAKRSHIEIYSMDWVQSLPGRITQGCQLGQGLEAQPILSCSHVLYKHAHIHLCVPTCMFMCVCTSGL